MKYDTQDLMKIIKPKYSSSLKISKNEQKVNIPNKPTHAIGVQVSPGSQSSTTITGVVETTYVVFWLAELVKAFSYNYCRCRLEPSFMRPSGSLFCSAFGDDKIECWNVSHFPYLPHIFHIKQVK